MTNEQWQKLVNAKRACPSFFVLTSETNAIPPKTEDYDKLGILLDFETRKVCSRRLMMRSCDCVATEDAQRYCPRGNIYKTVRQLLAPPAIKQ